MFIQQPQKGIGIQSHATFCPYKKQSYSLLDFNLHTQLLYLMLQAKLRYRYFHLSFSAHPHKSIHPRSIFHERAIRLFFDLKGLGFVTLLCSFVPIPLLQMVCRSHQQGICQYLILLSPTGLWQARSLEVVGQPFSRQVVRLPEAEATLINTIIYPNCYNISTTSPIDALDAGVGFEPTIFSS